MTNRIATAMLCLLCCGSTLCGQTGPAVGRGTTSSVHAFERALENAVQRGMERFIKSAKKADPGFQSTPAASEAEGIRPAIPDGGILFVVRVPPLMSVHTPLAPAPPASQANFDPDAAYLNALCEALIETMLNESAAIPLVDSEWLTVVLTTARQRAEQPRGRQVQFSIKGSDLARLRQGQITAAAAKSLVRVSREAR